MGQLSRLSLFEHISQLSAAEVVVGSRLRQKRIYIQFLVNHLMWYMLLDLFCKPVKKSYSTLLMTVFPLVRIHSASARISHQFDSSGDDY